MKLKKSTVAIIVLLGLVFVASSLIKVGSSKNEAFHLDVKNAEFIEYNEMWNVLVYKEKNQEPKSIALYGIMVAPQELLMTDEEFRETLLSPIPPKVWIYHILKGQKISIQFEGEDEFLDFRGGYVFYGKDNTFLQEDLVRRGIAEPFSLPSMNEEYKEKIRQAHEKAKEEKRGVHLKSKGSVPQFAE